MENAQRIQFALVHPANAADAFEIIRNAAARGGERRGFDAHRIGFVRG